MDKSLKYALSSILHLADVFLSWEFAGRHLATISVDDYYDILVIFTGAWRYSRKLLNQKEPKT